MKYFIDKNNNIYTGSSSGRIYKCLANETDFHEITKVPKPISSIVIDKNNNIFLLSINVNYVRGEDIEVYKCLAGGDTCNKIKIINNVLFGKLLLDSNNNNIYMGITKTNDKCEVYKCLAGEGICNKIKTINNAPISDFTLDKNNNIYIIDTSSSVYKMLSNDKSIHIINNQLFISNNTIIIDQKNKVYISNSDYGVYESD
ncbi:hypothetical protein [Spiroplasma endosymbiont of Polydrusus pterygomalis]|uniref:hypothetical protein n=1 Tax=Spiroplasma endosymbiont of Polydrusus pterygomalis TaxID=3139327 RepID=UPI003CCB2102